MYQSCPSGDCKKKVTEGMGGHGFFCEKCNQHFPDFRWRLMLSVSAGVWVKGKCRCTLGSLCEVCVCVYVYIRNCMICMYTYIRTCA